MASIEDRTLAVTDLPAGNLRGSARLPNHRRRLGPFFATDQRVGLLVTESVGVLQNPPAIRSLEFDVLAQELIEVGVLDAGGVPIRMIRDLDRNRLLLETRFDRESTWRYLDAGSFSDVPWSRDLDLGSEVSMLADGDLVRWVREPEGSRLDILSPEGGLVGTVPLPLGVELLVIGWQPTSTTLVVATSDQGWSDWWYDSWKSLEVDLESGEIREIGGEIVPVTWWHRAGAVSRPMPAGCPASRLFIGRGSALWMWDQADDQLDQLVHGRR
jgi:hypothetical protein